MVKCGASDKGEIRARDASNCERKTMKCTQQCTTLTSSIRITGKEAIDRQDSIRDGQRCAGKRERRFATTTGSNGQAKIGSR